MNAVRFGMFEADFATGELWKQGRRVVLQGQPFQVLSILLRRAGDLVTREELRQALWPDAAHGEFDEGVNTAIRKVRLALGDDSSNPRFIETLPRKGYRFIAPVSKGLATSRLPAFQQASRLPSVAVLPFENLGAGEAGQIFSDGLTDDIINVMAQVAGLRITARTSAFAFKGKRVDLRSIGEVLGVAHILEGSMRQSGDRVRVNVQLVRVADGSTMWSQRFDREVNDLFTIQDEISQAIADALKVRLVGEAGQRHSARNAEAYRFLVEGRYHLARSSPQNLALGQRAFTRAIELDADFAQAHAGLAEALLFQAYQCLASHGPAKEHAEQSISLDPNCAEAWVVRAQLRGIFEYDWQGAETDFQRALRLNPSSAEVWDRYGALHLRVLGRFDDAHDAHRRALELDPLAPLPRTNCAFALLLLGRYDEAVEGARAALNLFPDHPLVQHHACMIFEAAGHSEEALALAKQGMESADMLGWSSAAYLAKKPADAIQLLRRIGEYSQHQVRWPSLLCLPCAAAGEIGSALDWVDRAVEEHDAHFLLECRAPGYSVLRAHGRFASALRRAGLG